MAVNSRHRKRLSDITPLAQGLTTINKWDFMKSRSFYMANDTVIWTKQQHREWEKVFVKYTFDRGLVSKVYK